MITDISEDIMRQLSMLPIHQLADDPQRGGPKPRPTVDLDGQPLLPIITSMDILSYFLSGMALPDVPDALDVQILIIDDELSLLGVLHVSYPHEITGGNLSNRGGTVVLVVIRISMPF